jgi:arabinan endo-1,5-alpha-L-arabinosidase
MRTNAATTVFDEYGTHTATAVNGALLGEAYGKRDFGVSLDGVDDHLNIPDNNNLSFTDGGGNDLPFTFSAWVKPEAGMAFGTLIAKDQYISGWAQEYTLYLATNAAYMTLWSSDRAKEITAIGSGIIPAGTWSHVAYTYNGNEATNGISIYINGVLANMTYSKTGTYTGMSNSSRSVQIGWRYSALHDDIALKSAVDEVALWSRALSSSEVYQLYSTPLYAPYKP